MKWRAERFAAVAGALLLAACGGGGDRPGATLPRARHWIASDVPVKIGPPYRAAGRTWVPVDDRGYDAIGIATWYGAAHEGAATASGERFERARISAAHPTLPLPSYVAVTALDSGRTILVRINDRGPFDPARIIDLSQAAARMLGIEAQGHARVRVRRIEPSGSDRALLRAGRPAAMRVALRPMPGYQHGMPVADAAAPSISSRNP